MSRTYRRKNYEDTQGTSWDRKGRKTNGYYTTYDLDTYLDQIYNCVRCCNRQYRPMDERERFEAYRWAHLDGHPNDRTPSRWYRLKRQKQNRSINKCELIKWFKADGEYEPMFEPNPRSHLWDWR